MKKVEKMTMKKIGLEKEVVARIVFNILFFLMALFSLILLIIEHAGALPIAVIVLFLLLFLFATVTEFYDRILYDDTHLEVRTFAGTERIDYADIIRVDRTFISHHTGKGGGHWRYHVRVKTSDSEQKDIAVPFPQFVTNEHLQDLFAQIRQANAEVKWGLPLNG